MSFPGRVRHGDVERGPLKGEPKCPADKHQGNDDRRDDHDRYEPPEGLANARRDYRFLRLVHEIAPTRAQEPRIVRLKHKAARDLREGEFLHALVKSRHGPQGNREEAFLGVAHDELSPEVRIDDPVTDAPGDHGNDC